MTPRGKKLRKELKFWSDIAWFSGFILFGLAYLAITKLYELFGGNLNTISTGAGFFVIGLSIYIAYKCLDSHDKSLKRQIDAEGSKEKKALKKFIDDENKKEEEILKEKKRIEDERVENLRKIHELYSSKRKRRLKILGKIKDEKASLSKALSILKKENVINFLEQIIKNPMSEKYFPFYSKDLKCYAPKEQIVNIYKNIYGEDRSYDEITKSRNIKFHHYEYKGNKYLIVQYITFIEGDSITPRPWGGNNGGYLTLYYNNEIKLNLILRNDKSVGVSQTIDDRTSTYTKLSNYYMFNISSDWVNGLKEIKNIVITATKNWEESKRKEKEKNIKISDYE